MALVIENLSHVYNKGEPFQSIALENINLTINDGDFIALIGHTGSGKSTLAQHLNGLISPTEGKVLLDGQDINSKEVSKRNVRFKVGLVFQYPEYQLFEESVAKDIAFGPKNMGLSDEEVDFRVRRAMDVVGLNYDEMAEKSPFELSGGQMRRVALAGVLAMEPKVLVLDEPSAGLDPRAKGFLMKDIQRLHENGTTIVMITHNMDDVANYAKRVAVLKEGRIVLEGEPDKVFENYDLLSSMGLDIPQASVLSHKLKVEGMPVENCFRISDMADEISRILTGGEKQ